MSRFAERRSPPPAPLSLGLVGAGFLVLAATALTDGKLPLIAAVALAVAVGLSLVPSGRLDWRVLLAGLIAVILFIPIRRYTLPGNLPFQLEPYRILVALLLGGWFVSLLVDSRVRLRRSFVDPPIALIAIAILGSVVVNPSRVAGLQADVLKSIMFFASFFLVFYLIVSVMRTSREIDFVLKVLLGGGAVVAVLAVVEYRTGFNAYDALLGVVPFLAYDAGAAELVRSAGVRRAFGSAEHPIALGAALALLIPGAIYMAKKSGRKRWWCVLLLLVFGVLATVSRTSVLMLVAAGLVILFLRPGEIKRLAPLAIAVLFLAQVAVPGSLGTLRYFFLPQEGLVAQQKSSEGSCSSAGRIADLGPSLAEYSQRPVVGYGFGTRIPTGERANACILDNQWLGSLLEIGTVGVLGWLWLFCRFTRGLAREARRDPSPDGWLPTALASATVAYAVGMLTFDAFSFIQVTFMMFILFGLGAVAVAERARRRSVESSGVSRTAGRELRAL